VARKLFKFEEESWAKGATLTCGIDEAGRGPLAGPVVAAAVVLPREYKCKGLRDSKKLTAGLREELYEKLTKDPLVHWAVASVDPREIDTINILQATWKAMLAARSSLSCTPDWTLVDGNRVPPLGERQTSIVGGDDLSLSIAAASVIAKVTRDRYMLDQHECYPEYGFASHKGYSTEEHLDVLMSRGPCPIHRFSFEPVQIAQFFTKGKLPA
jgi:ribonuclease HII